MERRTYRVCRRNSIIHRDFFASAIFSRAETRTSDREVGNGGGEHGKDDEAKGIVFLLPKSTRRRLGAGFDLLQEIGCSKYDERHDQDRARDNLLFFRFCSSQS
jgi:hypothetical protein